VSPDTIRIGDVLANTDLTKTFKVGNMGGMRRSKGLNLLVIISDPSKGLYKDHWERDVLHYTGMGKIGDQSLDSTQNKTLAGSGSNGVDVHLFEVHQPTRYTYQGRVSLVGKPYRENQPDVEDKTRKVWMFPLKLKDVALPQAPTETELVEQHAHSEREAHKLTDKELEKRALAATNKPFRHNVRSTVIERDPYVAEFARRRANGICDLCNNKAPFSKRGGDPYLEVHHVVWLSKGGPDTIDNTVALCPNCHRKMHVCALQRDVTLLQRVAIHGR
jgi:5-methylcytosine-specific restriction protein A